MAGLRMRRFSLRTILLFVVLGALLLVIAGIGGLTLRRLQSSLESAYRNQRENAAHQLEARTQDYLSQVEQQSAINCQFFKDGVLSFDDLPSLARHWVSVMHEKRQLSSMSASQAGTGQMLEVSRLPSGELSIRLLAPDPATGHLRARDYRPGDFPDRAYNEIANKDDGDPRQRPWFRQAVNAGRAVWTPTYEFISAGGTANRLGVTHAAPLYGPQGQLLGVVTTDVALDELNQILAELIPPQTGVGLIVERRGAGQTRLLAQNDAQRWAAMLPASLRQRLGGDDIATLLAKQLGQDQLDENSFDRKVHIPSGELLLSMVVLDSAARPGADPPWVLVLFSPPNAFLVQLKQDVRFVSLIILLIVLASALLSLALAQNISRPLALLAGQLERYGRLELDTVDAPPSAIREVDQLSRSSQSMAMGLRSFLKYVPASLVRQLVAGGEEAILGGEERELTVMFVDIAGFTQLSETLSPTDLVGLLGGVNEMLAAEIERHGGTLDKFLGDGLMAFWGAPEVRPSHALDACRAAASILERLRQVNAGRREAGRRELQMRFGLASGKSVVGNFGSTHRISYTAMGDVVNTAAALEQMNKVYGTTVLLDPGVVAALDGAMLARPVDRLKLKGKRQALLLYELLLPTATSVPQDATDRAQAYTAALESYTRGAWAAACEQFEQLLVSSPADGPARILLERCRRFQASPPPDWDGSIEMARIAPSLG